LPRSLVVGDCAPAIPEETQITIAATILLTTLALLQTSILRSSAER
jgi:hypothetical protein